MLVARVMILNKYADIEQALDYFLPVGMQAPPGSIVQVPLGSRLVEGVVFAHPEVPEVPELKEVLSVSERRLPLEFIDLACWLAVRAGCSIATALSAMLPPAGSGLSPVRWQIDEQAATAISLTEKQQLVADLVRQQSPMQKTEISRALGISLAPINSLIAKGVLLPTKGKAPAQDWNFQQVAELTSDQARVIAVIRAESEGFQKGGTFVLHGVTGSGKTEVYIRLTREVLAAGRQVLVLVPEIALTAQLVARFRAAFGTGVSVFHSGLSGSRRASEWDRISRGDAAIVIGTRSAVYAPLDNLGLVVMDEEHELAYKQEETPRYHARDVALYRARQHGAVVVMGSATPSLETYSRALSGQYRLLEMPKRVHSLHPVVAEIVDMRRELQLGNRGMLSRSLTQALADTLARNEQALLFLNRRGLAPTVLCRNCGFRYTCPNCSTSLTLHGHGLLRCHHCGETARISGVCPECGSKYLRELGVGTQKLEAHLASRFPGVHLCRIDRDTAGTALDKELHLYNFYQQESGILLGTQMIAKGLDFPKVTLVGIVLADLSLAMSDFRAAERTFQLVTQAGGRTGRAQLPGRVIIQTYQPEHYSLQFALAGDYLGFYRHEMGVRNKAGLPPFSALTRILISAKEQPQLMKQVEQITALLRQENYNLLFSGPPPLERLKGRYRWHLLLRHSLANSPWEKVERLRRSIRGDKYTRVIIDNNPYNFM
ncbi:MAG TPA: primosomal protein N' [Firmicutes bacterium]|nr:primosomal protein N' [Bacillota bacterium]